MQVKNDGLHEGYLTIRQWAKKGYLPKENITGTRLWANRNCQQSFLYYTKDEVELATQTALDAYWQPERQRRADRRKALAAERQAALERERQEMQEHMAALESQVQQLSQTLREVLPLCSKPPEHTADNIVIDIETTGLEIGKDEILQVSIISGTGETLYDSYIKPIFTNEWKAAQRINHISPEMVANAPNIYQEIPKINAILSAARTIIGYNHIHFDLPFLWHYGAVIPDGQTDCYDVMLEFAPIYGEWNERHGDYKWQNLSTCAAYYGYDWNDDAAHNSLADCRATLHCYHRIKEELEMNQKELDERNADKDKDGIPDRIDSSFSPPEDELRYASVSPAFCDYLQEQGFYFSKGKKDGDNMIIAYRASDRGAFENLQAAHRLTFGKGGRNI